MERTLIGEYEHLHRTSRYGATGHKALPYLLPHLLALRPKSLVDYGCGQSHLAEALSRKAGIPVTARYDPAIPEVSVRPSQVFDVVVNVDVLEHVPDVEIDSVAGDMAALGRHALLVIDTGPALTLLSNGCNAHVSQHDGPWWLQRLLPHFPALRPISIGRPRRVAFKTWDQTLPLLEHKAIEWRERVARHAARWLSGRQRRRAPVSK